MHFLPDRQPRTGVDSEADNLVQDTKRGQLGSVAKSRQPDANESSGLPSQYGPHGRQQRTLRKARTPPRVAVLGSQE